MLWYSAPHKDWDITNGSAPQEVSNFFVTRLDTIIQAVALACTALASRQVVHGFLPEHCVATQHFAGKAPSLASQIQLSGNGTVPLYLTTVLGGSYRFNSLNLNTTQMNCSHAG